MTDLKILATIDLDGVPGRGELYLHDGAIWCRTPGGETHETGVRAADEDDAIDAIHQSWGAPGVWGLEWTEADV